MNTIESNSADAILQKKKKIKVGKHVFCISSPTIATLIEASKEISYLPEIELDKDKYIYESLHIAKNCENLGKIVAILILGASKQTNTQPSKNKLLKWLKIENNKSEIEKLADYIKYNLSPKEFETLLIEVLKTMELANFFLATTSLLEVNLLKKTR